MSLAIIKTGGKQYKVKMGSVLKVEKISGQPGDLVNFETLLLGNESGEKMEIGKPLLEKKVEGKILEQGRGKKISVVKYKSKVRYRRRAGHRQLYTKIKIVKI